MNTLHIEEFSKAGLPFVQMPKADFEALMQHVRELEDVQAIRGAQQQQHAGEECLPLVLSRRILLGESAIRVYRQFRGLSQAVLAQMAGINRAYLSEIETGKKPGSKRAIKAIAGALKVHMDDLV